MLRGANRNKIRQLLVLISVLVVTLAAVFVLTRGPGDRICILQADFGASSVLPGGSTSLTIRIKNTSGEFDAYNISVEVTPSDATAVQVENAQVVVDTLGAGEERVIEFSVSVAQGSLPGKYKLKATTSAGSIFEGENRDLYLDVVGS